MKIMIVSLAALALSSFQGVPIKDKNVKQDLPVINWVETTMSYEPGLVTIRGRHFDFVTEVKIDGKAVPIVRHGQTEMDVQPGPMAPGFTTVEVIRRPGVSASAPIEFAPSLVGTRNRDLIRLVVNPGESGFIFVNWSYRRLATPMTIAGTYYPQFLDLSIPNSGTLAMTSSVAGEPVVVVAKVPPLVQAPVHVTSVGPVSFQAYSLLGHDMQPCHSNPVTLPIIVEPTLSDARPPTWPPQVP